MTPPFSATDVPSATTQGSPEGTPLQQQAVKATYSPYEQLTLSSPGTRAQVMNNDGTMSIPPLDAKGQQEYSALMAVVKDPKGGPSDAQVLQTFQGGSGAAQTADDPNFIPGTPQIPMWMRFAPNSAELMNNATMAWQAQVDAANKAAAAQKTETKPAATTTAGDGTQQADGTTTPSTDQTTPTTVPDATTGTSGPAVSADVLNAATQNFISQNKSQFNPAAPETDKDCGPTSLAMALKFAGVFPPGQNPQNAEQLVEDARLKMTGSKDHESITTLNQVIDASTTYGVKTKIVSGLSDIDTALQNGDVVVSAGNPAGAGAYGNRLTDAQYNKFNGAHVIMIAGKAGDNYIINDPLSKVGAVAVTAQELQAFINDPQQRLHGGIAIAKKGQAA